MATKIATSILRVVLAFIWSIARSMQGNLRWLALGVVFSALYFNYTAGPGAILIPRGEAEGVEYSDPDMIDMISDVKHLRDCAGATQRYAWRYVWRKGVRGQQVIPLTGTVAPFLAETGFVMVTVPVRDVPDRLQKDAGWMYRAVTDERCPALPEIAANALGNHLKRGPDMPLNFVGDPHTDTSVAPK